MRTLALLVTVFWISLSAASARAATAPVDESGLTLDRVDLPLESRDPRVLLQVARSMPEVKSAMAEFKARGYVAHPEHDTVAMPAPGTSAVCFLMNEKPGYVAAPNTLGAPVIMVGTVKSLDATRTRVSGGFVVLDNATHSWRVLDPGSESSAGINIRDTPIEVRPDRIVELVERDLAAIGRYAACAALGNGLCIAGGIAAGVFAPVAGVAVGIGCIANRTTACLDQAISSWPR